jgi:hypothetical protein
MMRLMRARLLVFAVLVAVAGCATAPSSPATGSLPASMSGAGTQVAVTLGIYSGRPDPTWVLSPAEAAGLAARIGALASKVGVPPQGGLGYHGFSIVIAADGQPDQPLVAYRGTVASEGTGKRRFGLDPTRSIERYLLATGASHLAPNETAAVEADLSAGGAAPSP